MTRARIVWPTLIAMCGLPFAGKSVLARSLSHELGIRLLSYDFEIYLPHRHLVPPGSSVAAGYDFVQDIARRQIGALLAAGESLIYDDLLLGRDDRRKMAVVARHHRADFVLVYLDTPLAVIDQRQTDNARTRTRHSVPEGEMRLEVSLLEPPDATEQAIAVRPGDDLTDVLTRISARLRSEGHTSLLRTAPASTAAPAASAERYHRLVLPFSAQTRTANLTRMAEDRLDVLVIGGGITGVGIALDAAARGLSVALVEKDDFAAGTSGRSSRLVHGGLRYLEHGEFGLVRESLRERGILFRLAPHLVRPVPMYMLADDLRHRATYRVGLTGYELLAAGRNIGYHRSVSGGQVLAAIPGLGGRSRGFRYFECQVDDARLTIEVARAAHAFGARLANHARVTELLGEGRVTGAVVTDEMTGQRFEVRARAVINATGVWADAVARLAGAGLAGAGLAGVGGGRLLPSKGVHLVFAPGAVRTTAALVAPSGADDGRYIFIVPWEDRVYAGTTDTPYTGDLDDPAVDAADRDYLLSAVARNFPGVTERDVVASWAGLRPLLSQDEELGDARTSDLSRKHAIFTGPFGLFTITGGKLTTYRAMAEDLVDRVAAVLGGAGPGRTRGIPLGLHGSPAAAVHMARAEVARLGLPPRSAARLVQRYGDDWREAVRLIGEDRSLGEPVVSTLPVLGVEVALARRREMALTDEDVFVRRTRLTTRDASLGLIPSGGHLRE